MPISEKPYRQKTFATVKSKRMAYIEYGGDECNRFPTRESHFLVSLAQHHAVLRRVGSLDRLRFDRHGRFGQARELRSRALHICRTMQLSVCTVGKDRLGRQGHLGAP